MNPFKELQWKLKRSGEGNLDEELSSNAYTETRQITESISKTYRKTKGGGSVKGRIRIECIPAS